MTQDDLTVLIEVAFATLFFFNDTATTEIYTLSLHDALPISTPPPRGLDPPARNSARCATHRCGAPSRTPPPSAECGVRSEEHTSELQSRLHLVCRLLLEKKKKTQELLQRGLINTRDTTITAS